MSLTSWFNPSFAKAKHLILKKYKSWTVFTKRSYNQCRNAYMNNRFGINTVNACIYFCSALM